MKPIQYKGHTICDAHQNAVEKHLTGLSTLTAIHIRRYGSARNTNTYILRKAFNYKRNDKEQLAEVIDRAKQYIDTNP